MNMATDPQISQAISSYFQAEWGSRAQVAYHNMPFKPPQTGEDWLRFSLREAIDQRVNIGGEAGLRRRAITGLVLIQAFTQLSKGTYPSDTHVAEIKRIFRDVSLDSPSIRFGDIRVNSPVAEDDFLMTYITVEYVADVLH